MEGNADNLEKGDITVLHSIVMDANKCLNYTRKRRCG